MALTAAQKQDATALALAIQTQTKARDDKRQKEEIEKRKDAIQRKVERQQGRKL